MAKDGTVAVALGWRVIGGDLRVGYWVGSDGKEGEISIPRERVERWRYCDGLQGVRGTLLETSRNALVAWVAARTDLPEEFRRRTETLPQWRSAARLASFVIWWRDNRVPGDEGIFRLLEGERVEDKDGRGSYTGGRKQDKHLYDWEANQRMNCVHWRKNFYAHVALDLGRRYKDLIVEEIDWHGIGENAPPEEADDQVNKLNRGVAAVASLRDSLTRVMDRRTDVDPAYVVRDCHVCGTRCPDPGAGRYITCETCGGERRDRLENAAKNLLDRGLGREKTPPAPRGPEVPPPAKPVKKGGKTAKAK